MKLINPLYSWTYNGVSHTGAAFSKIAGLSFYGYWTLLRYYGKEVVWYGTENFGKFI